MTNCSPRERIHDVHGEGVAGEPGFDSVECSVLGWVVFFELTAMAVDEGLLDQLVVTVLPEAFPKLG